jgi:sulfate-transporting ATPase
VSVFLQFVLLGLGTGGVYAIIGLGVVLIFRGSGTVNFAQGAMAMVGSYAFYYLRVTHNLPWVAAMVASVALVACVGLVTFLLVMRPLGRSSKLAGIIASLGILLVLESIVTLPYGTDSLIVPAFLPARAISILGTHVQEDFVIYFAIAVGLTLLLWPLYRYSRFGVATSAVSENSQVLAAAGRSPTFVGAVNWTLGGGLAGLAGVLFAPIDALQVTTLTLLIIPALGAALAGNLSSFPLTLAGAAGIGILQSEMGRYFPGTPGLPDSLPFFAVIVILVARGRALPLRSHIADRLPQVGSGRFRLAIVGPAAVIAAMLLEVLPADWKLAATTSLISAIILLSLVVVTGYAGQISLAQYAFAGFGALVAGRLVSSLHMPFLVAAAIGIAATVPLGLLVGLSASRTRGVALAITTLGFGVALQALVFDNYSYTGGANGTNVGTPEFFGLSMDPATHPERYGLLALAVFVICGLAVVNLRRGRAGRRLLAVRANERAAASLGVNVVGAKLWAFVIAAAISGIGGVLLAFESPYVIYDQFSPLASISAVGDIVVGGVGFVGGALFGGLIQTGGIFQYVLNDIVSGWDRYLTLIAGIGLVLTVLKLPDGVFPANLEMVASALKRSRRSGRNQPSWTDVRVFRRRSGSSVLEVRDLAVSFGGVRALDGVSFTLRSGQVLGVIGPNGAGKTTLIDALTGFVSSSGTMLLDGEDISRRTAARRSRAGLGRSFQQLELFEHLSVLENILVACDAQDARAYVTNLVVPGRLSVGPAARTAIESLDLSDVLDQLPGDLSYGKRRLVAIARALAMDPSVLMLDEPAAGLDEHEREEIVVLIRRMAEEDRIAVLLVEHDVGIVRQVSDELLVLDFGEQIAAGDPGEVLSDSRVVAAYLGEIYPAGAR